jgi:hypothetical protein
MTHEVALGDKTLSNNLEHLGSDFAAGMYAPVAGLVECLVY